MHKIKAALIVVAMLVISSADGRPDDPVLSVYLNAMKRLSNRCTIHYRSSCYYGDKKQSAILGKLAINGDNYYDSSNARFIFKNKSWVLMADHQSKMVNTIYLPEWKKKMGKAFEPDIAGFLMSTADMSDFSAFKLKPLGKDSFMVSVQYQMEGGQGIDLRLYYAKGADLPAHYEGTLTYSLDGDAKADGTSSAAIRIFFECTGISKDVDDGLFDDNRLIRQSGAKAQLKRFNDYRAYKRAS